MDVPDLNLSEKQWRYLAQANHSFNILWGPVRSGKTFANNLRWSIYYRHQCPPGSMLLLSGKSSEALYNNVLADLIKMDPRLVHSRSPHKLYYPDRDITMLCVGADDEADWKRIAGSTIAGWYANEITIAPKSFVDMAITRCSAGSRLKLWDCNPNSPTHFIKTDYLDARDLDIYSEFFSFDDNPVLSQDYITEMKKAFTGLFYRRYILGEWVGFEGIIYDNFRVDHHVIDPFTIPENWPRYRVIDWGFVAPQHALVVQWWAKKPHGVQPKGAGLPYHECYVLYRELYRTGMIVEDMAKEVTRVSAGERYPSGEWCDWDDTNMETAKRHGLYRLTRAIKGKTVKEKVEKIYSALSRDQIFFVRSARYHPPDAALLQAKVPTSTIEEIPVQSWQTDRNGVTNREEPVKDHDHGCDAMGYFLLSVDQVGSVRAMDQLEYGRQ